MTVHTWRDGLIGACCSFHVQFSAPTLDCLQPPVTPTPEKPHTLPWPRAHTHIFIIQIQKHIYIHLKNKSFLRLKFRQVNTKVHIEN